jgi:hypothetical protein
MGKSETLRHAPLLFPLPACRDRIGAGEGQPTICVNCDNFGVGRDSVEPTLLRFAEEVKLGLDGVTPHHGCQ